MSAIHPSLIEVPMPILTPRLLLRPPEAGDGAAYHAAINASREHLRRFLPWVDGGHLTLEDSENSVRLCQVKYLSRTDIALAIFDRKSARLLGGSGLHRMDWSVPKFEIGYWIHRDFEGQGIITEAVNAITRYAVQQLLAKRIEIRCDADNLRSRAVAERLGFQLEGRLRQDRLNEKQELADTCVYARLDGEGLPELAVNWS